MQINTYHIYLQSANFVIKFYKILPFLSIKYVSDCGQGQILAHWMRYVVYKPQSQRTNDDKQSDDIEKQMWHQRQNKYFPNRYFLPHILINISWNSTNFTFCGHVFWFMIEFCLKSIQTSVWVLMCWPFGRHGVYCAGHLVLHKYRYVVTLWLMVNGVTVVTHIH